MMIDSARYLSDGTISAVIDGIVMAVPDDPENGHRRLVAAWELEGNTIAPYEPILPVPESISRSQLILGLATLELITPEEALAAARAGEVPAAVQAVFDALQPADKLKAEVRWASMQVAERDHPLVALLAAANDMGAGEVDDFFRLAAGL